jgi:predicted nucleic acid-binding protein
MDSIVLDASAALRTVLSPVDHPDLLEAIESASDVLAPQLFAAETANALWKYHQAGRLDGQTIRHRHAEVLALVSLWIPDTSLFPEVLSLAAKLNHPVYDCLYLIAARRFDARLLTADRRLETLYARIC